jgi:hypothetical protein
LKETYNVSIEAVEINLPAYIFFLLYDVFSLFLQLLQVCEAFNIGKAKAVILTISQPMETNHAVVNLRRLYPDLKIFARAKDAKHQERLQKTLNVVAMVPILPEENLLLTLPFGGAVLKSLGASVEEVTFFFIMEPTFSPLLFLSILTRLNYFLYVFSTLGKFHFREQTKGVNEFKRFRQRRWTNCVGTRWSS